MNRLFIENSNNVLKTIFNKEENLDIAKDFIESILEIDIKEIMLRPYLGEKIKYLPDEEKYGIAVYRVVDTFNNEFNIGIQIIDGLYAQEKLLIYGASIHANQVEYEDYADITNTITINIIDSKVFQTPKSHKVLEFVGKSERNDFVMVSDELVFHVLQLPDYKEDIPKTKEDKWIAYFKGEDTEMIKQNNKAIKKLDDILMDYWKNEKI